MFFLNFFYKPNNSIFIQIHFKKVLQEVDLTENSEWYINLISWNNKIRQMKNKFTDIINDTYIERQIIGLYMISFH